MANRRPQVAQSDRFRESSPGGKWNPGLEFPLYVLEQDAKAGNTQAAERLAYIALDLEHFHKTYSLKTWPQKNTKNTKKAFFFEFFARFRGFSTGGLRYMINTNALAKTLDRLAQTSLGVLKPYARWCSVWPVVAAKREMQAGRGAGKGRARRTTGNRTGRGFAGLGASTKARA